MFNQSPNVGRENATAVGGVISDSDIKADRLKSKKPA
jgi:hypothetical protein